MMPRSSSWPNSLLICLALSILMIWSSSPAASDESMAKALGRHLDTVEQQAERLRQQIAHPQGRPQAREELLDLIRHLERLDRATAEVGGNAGLVLEERRLAMLDAVSKGDRVSSQSSASETMPVAGTGSISGRVTKASDGTPFVNVHISAYLGNSTSSVTSIQTDQNGDYVLSGLADGTFYVAARSFSGSAVSEMYDNIHCESSVPCRLIESTLVPVSGGGDTPSINFALSERGIIRGRVWDQEGSPIAGIRVNAVNGAGLTFRSAITDVAGRYAITGIFPGNYYLRAESDGHLDEVYPDLPCEDGSCNHTDGTVLSIAFDQQINDRNFILNRRGTLTGKVVDATNASPTGWTDLEIFDESGNQVRVVSTDGLGKWLIGDLAAGTYFARASSYGYQAALYDDIPCPDNCPPLNGTAITLPEGGVLSQIDFELRRLGSISGSIRASDSPGRISGAHANVFNSAGNFVGETHVADTGDFLVSRLPAGQYFVRAQGIEYQSELWQDLPCPLGTCNPTLGTQVAVALEQTTGGIDFLLEPLGAISGQVTRSAGSPLNDTTAGINIYRSSDNSWVKDSSVLPDGYYRVGGLEAGSYKVAFESVIYRHELFDDIPCPGECQPALGQDVAVNIGATTSGIDFQVERMGFVSGQVTDAETGNPVSFVRVEIISEDNLVLASDETDQLGYFSTLGLPAGTYFAKANPRFDHEFVAQIWDGISCNVCPDPTNVGTPFAVTIENETTGINFALTRGSEIVGTVIDSQTGQPLISAFVTLYGSNGNSLAGVPTSLLGRFSLGKLDLGTYYLSAGISSNNLWTREVWPDVVCPIQGACNPHQVGTPIVFASHGLATADFSLDRLGILTGRVTDGETGNFVPSGGVRVFTATDQPINLGWSFGVDNAGLYRIGGLMPGSYKIVSTSNSNHIERVLGGSNCESTPCDLSTATTIPVSFNQTILAPNLTLDFGPGISGTIRKAGKPAPGVAVDVWWQPNAQYFMTVVSGANGRYQVPTFGPGWLLSTDNGGAFVDEVFDNISCPNGPAFLGLCDPLLGQSVEAPFGQTAIDGIDIDLESIEVFADGFESGDLGAWSGSSP